MKNGTDLSSKDFPQYISNPSKVNSKPLLPSKPLNQTTRNTPLLTTAQKQAQERVQRYFRNDEIGTKFVKNITTEDGYKALGMYKDKLITFAKNPSKNTIDHEAFHAYFDIALGKQEKNTFLNLVQKRQNLASKIDAEEWMADTFADFVAGREAQTGLTGKFKTFFQDLAYKFKNFFGKADKVEGLFRELEAIGKGKKELIITSVRGNKKAQAKYRKGQDDILDSINPTGSIMVEYTPEIRAKAKLADNITTLAETMGKSGDEYITIYRGTIAKQKEINP